MAKRGSKLSAEDRYYLAMAVWRKFKDRKRRRGKDLDGGGVPVEPDSPKNLSGGAAAQLEFDE